MELNTIYVLAAAVALISCLLYPLRGNATHQVGVSISVHGRFLV